MGCLLELIFEVFVEGLFELIGYGYLKLMQLIVPHKMISENAKKVIKKTATVIAAVLAVALIIGFILLFQEDPFTHRIGQYVTYISLAMMGIQIVLGIIARIISHFKK